MKKLLSVIFVIFLSIASVMLGFSWKNNAESQNSAFAVKESEIQNKEYILDPKNLHSSFYNDKKANDTLFDNEKKALFEGDVIVPKTTGEQKDIDSSYQLRTFRLSETESVFIWIFIPHEYVYNLSVSFETAYGKSASWEISVSALKNKLQESSINENYGWKLFEFPVADAVVSDDIKSNLSETDFYQFKISYKNNNQVLVLESLENNFMFYGIYKATSISQNIEIIRNQSYVTYKLDDEFDSQTSFYINQEIYITKLQDMFDYLIVGDDNFLKNIPDEFTIEVNMKDSNKETNKLEFGGKFVFENSGYHTLSINIKEKSSLRETSVLYYTINIEALEFNIGSFDKNEYELNVDETLFISFKISSEFIKESDFVIEVEDKSLAEVTYYIEGNVCNINLKSLKKGRTKLIVKATGSYSGSYEIVEYKEEVSIEIKNPNEKSSSELFLWLVLGIYGVGFVTFIVISLVKARQTSVK